MLKKKDFEIDVLNKAHLVNVLFTVSILFERFENF